MSGRRQWGDDSTACVKLSQGGTLSLIFKGNLFDLSPDERGLIVDLTEVLQKYNEGKRRDEVNGQQATEA